MHLVETKIGKTVEFNFSGFQVPWKVFTLEMLWSAVCEAPINCLWYVVNGHWFNYVYIS